MELAKCLVMEWGLGLVVAGFIGTIILAFVVASVVAWATRKWGPSSASIGSLSISGAAPLVAVVVVFVALGAIGWAGVKIGAISLPAFSVEMAPSGSVTLQKIRDEFQRETTMTVLVSHQAEQFQIKGDYEGYCVSDLLQKICRQYANELSCEISYWNRTLSIDLAHR